MGLILHVDGGSRGNPGPAGAGVVIAWDDGRVVHEAGYFLGTQTNNAAEYHACIRALQRAQRCGPQPLHVHSDSELLVRQVTGEYQVKNPKLEALYRQVQLLLLKAPRWQFKHVPREKNRRADQLANMAMDAGADVIVFEADATEAADPTAPPPTAKPPEAADTTAQSPTDEPPVAPRPAEPAAAQPVVAPGDATRRVVVEIARQPGPGCCPAECFASDQYVVDAVLPAGWCLHAAQTFLPTILAMRNTQPQEFAAIPAMTLHCIRGGCDARFRIMPQLGVNGRPRGA